MVQKLLLPPSSKKARGGGRLENGKRVKLSHGISSFIKENGGKIR